MPLQRRRPVPLLPLPDVDHLPEDAPVFFLKATGEIFLDYESYAARLTFLLSRTFQCEYSGKSRLDYFTALQSEKAESKVVRERFPDELKGRVLASVQFQVMGRLDKLVDLVFERYKDRYFPGEKAFVDLGGDKYYARIDKVFPPQAIRDAHIAAAAAASSSTTPVPAPDDFTSILHKVGTDLNIDPKKAKEQDPSDEYLYTVQLMDEEHKFEGSFMEVKAKSLSRDRLTFSKSILKRYMRECVQRDASIAAPWIVKPSIAAAFGIASQQTEDVEAKNKEIREDKLAKRRKMNPDGTPSDYPMKKRRTEDGTGGVGGRPTGDGPKRPVKYPVEDLDLDPMSIHDGRVLRRVKTEVPTLPPKPLPHRTLDVPDADFELFIETWNMLSTFSKPLALSPFTLDDYAGALSHRSRAPGEECVLLAEIHASLTNVIGTDTSRVLGSSVPAPVLGFGGESMAVSESTDLAPEKKPFGHDDETPRASPSLPIEGTEGGETGVPSYGTTPEEMLRNRLIRRGTQYGKRWDRQAKLKSDTGRAGWERHLIGAICQRGGPVFLDNFVEIMKHLFKGDPALDDGADVSEVDGGLDGEGDGAGADGEMGSPNGNSGPPKSSQLTDLDQLSTSDQGPRPEDQYLLLPLGDKLSIVHYLITLAMGSKVVRTYMEEAENHLTELRKQRAEVNKARRALQERKTALDNPDAKKDTPASGAQNPTSEPPSRAPSEADLPTHADEPDEEEDQLMSSDAESMAPSETGSTAAARQALREEKLDEKRRFKLSLASRAREASAQRGSGGTTDARLSIEEELADNAFLEEHVEREFRRYQGVSRCRPLGRDRFLCRYWWFDGIGGMEIGKARPDGGRVPYGTGRIFIQGPSQEDWDLICDPQEYGAEGYETMTNRRKREEVVDDESSLVSTGGWAYYESAEELDSLMSWLNAKGTRENALRNAIIRWRDYILAGSEERHKDLADPSRPRTDPQVTSSGRRARVKAEVEYPAHYLGYRNLWKRH
ncbi:hypothetical protein JCM10212_000876 [Sporobolomyces blumeae]